MEEAVAVAVAATHRSQRETENDSVDETTEPPLKCVDENSSTAIVPEETNDDASQSKINNYDVQIKKEADKVEDTIYNESDKITNIETNNTEGKTELVENRSDNLNNDVAEEKNAETVEENAPIVSTVNSPKEEILNSNDGEVEVPQTQVTEDAEKKFGIKRSNSEDTPNDDCASKKLCQDLQETFQKQDSVLSQYISNLSCNTEEDINKHTENLITEIEMLRELANTKEIEWNNLIHLKKVKEEILLRLLRKKNIMSLHKMANNISELNKETLNKQVLQLGKNCVDDENDESNRIRQKQINISGNGVQLNSSGLIMMPVSSSIYCQSNINNFNIENYLNSYKSKEAINKPLMISPVNHLQNFPLPDVTLQSSKFNQQVGRHGPIKDVQSIIADHRQKHPETLQRRGRRLRSVLKNPHVPLAPRLPTPHPEPTLAEMGLLFGGVDPTPHLPPIDAMTLQQNALLSQPGVLANGMSFKDVLVQFANMTGNQQTGCTVTRLPPPPPYPEVTLHPVGNTSANQQFSAKMTQQQSSLLHGILTKSQPRQDNRFSTFSPTLARLLTAPEKNVPSNNTCRIGNNVNATNNFIPQKPCSEITITAVQPNNQANNRHQQEIVQLDEYEDTELEDDSTDRPLVIDESGKGESSSVTKDNGALDLVENEVPTCQGCHKREAQFVCAGCANQWYCSRECQVSAWDEHSEVCSG